MQEDSTHWKPSAEENNLLTSEQFPAEAGDVGARSRPISIAECPPPIGTWNNSFMSSASAPLDDSGILGSSSSVLNSSFGSSFGGNLPMPSATGARSRPIPIPTSVGRSWTSSWALNADLPDNSDASAYGSAASYPDDFQLPTLGSSLRDSQQYNLNCFSSPHQNLRVQQDLLASRLLASQFGDYGERRQSSYEQLGALMRQRQLNQLLTSRANNFGSDLSLNSSPPLSLLNQLRGSLSGLDSLALLNEERKQNKNKICNFCRRNGEEFFNHRLKDRQGRVLCPVLSSFKCKLCKATGPNAHTWKYCPLNPITKGKPRLTGLPPGVPLEKLFQNFSL